MCSHLVELMWSTIDARVVDLPLPVGPVTKIRPRGFSAERFTTSGSPNLSKEGTIDSITRKAAA